MHRPPGVKLHYEVELGLVIGQQVRKLPAQEEVKAFDAIRQYVLAIDMTARNVQDECRQAGLPWTAAKGFDTFCPISQPISRDRVKDPHNVTLSLAVNGQQRQRDSTNLMLFKIPRLLSEISGVMTLQPGDIVLTGTPKGVGEVKHGDVMEAHMESDGVLIESSQIRVPVVDVTI